MAKPSATPWMPRTGTFVAAAIRKLVNDGEARKATIILVREACAGHFGVLAATFADLSDINLEGAKILLSEPARGSYAMEYVVTQSGVPSYLYPLVATALDMARAARQAKGAAMGAQAQSFLIKKILESEDVKALKLPELFVNALCENLEDPYKGMKVEVPASAAAPAPPESQNSNSKPSESAELKG